MIRFFGECHRPSLKYLLNSRNDSNESLLMLKKGASKVNESLRRMQDSLTVYRSLPQNQKDYPHQSVLDQLKTWQRYRLLETHTALLDDPQYRAATEFILYDVYGGRT